MQIYCERRFRCSGGAAVTDGDEPVEFTLQKPRSPPAIACKHSCEEL
jgi:hypothetical protein